MFYAPLENTSTIEMFPYAVRLLFRGYLPTVATDVFPCRASSTDNVTMQLRFWSRSNLKHSSSSRASSHRRPAQTWAFVDVVRAGVQPAQMAKQVPLTAPGLIKNQPWQTVKSQKFFAYSHAHTHARTHTPWVRLPVRTLSGNVNQCLRSSKSSSQTVCCIYAPLKVLLRSTQNRGIVDVRPLSILVSLCKTFVYCKSRKDAAWRCPENFCAVKHSAI